jgi:hypothetical protein
MTLLVVLLIVLALGTGPYFPYSGPAFFRCQSCASVLSR